MPGLHARADSDPFTPDRPVTQIGPSPRAFTRAQRRCPSSVKDDARDGEGRCSVPRARLDIRARLDPPRSTRPSQDSE